MTERDDLPLHDYDHLPVGSLISRIRSLDAAGLQTLMEYEQGHANRVQVVSAMRNRLSGLKEGAQPSGGDPSTAGADTPPAAAGGSQVSEATSGPPVNPPPHGAPAEPGQR